MPKMDFETLLDRAKMTKSELAERLGIAPGSISRWGNNPPKYAMAYLELALKVRELANSI